MDERAYIEEAFENGLISEGEKEEMLAELELLPGVPFGDIGEADTSENSPVISLEPHDVFSEESQSRILADLEEIEARFLLGEITEEERNQEIQDILPEGYRVVEYADDKAREETASEQEWEDCDPHKPAAEVLEGIEVTEIPQADKDEPPEVDEEQIRQELKAQALRNIPETPDTNDPIWCLADDMARESERLTQLRAKAYPQVREMAEHNAELVLGLTLIGETLGLEVAGTPVRKTQTSRSIKEYRMLTTQAVVAVKQNLEQVGQLQNQLREAQKTITHLEIERRKLQTEADDRVEAAINRLRPTIEELRKRQQEAQEESALCFSVEKSPYFLAVSLYTGAHKEAEMHYIYLRPRKGKEGKYTPDLTKDFARAEKFASEEEAHDFRVRLIKRLRRGYRLFKPGLGIARKLAPATLEIRLQAPIKIVEDED